MDGSDLYGISIPALVEATGVHPDTARRWKRAGTAPHYRRGLVRLALRGQLGALSNDWEGFVLRQGQIWTPENRPVRPGDLRAIPYTYELIRELKRQLAEPQQWSLLPGPPT